MFKFSVLGSVVLFPSHVFMEHLLTLTIILDVYACESALHRSSVVVLQVRKPCFVRSIGEYLR